MPVQQIPFYVPPEIELGLRTGKYVQFGGVVRDLGGRVVKHLDPIDVLPKVPAKSALEAAKNTASKAVAVAKANKGKTAAVAVVAITAAGTGAYLIHKHNEKKRVAQEVLAAQFQSTVQEYLDAIKTGSLSVEIVDSMSGLIDSARKQAGGKKGGVEFVQDFLDALEIIVKGYTEDLYKVNDREFKLLAMPETNSKTPSLDTVAAYLHMQRDLFQAA